MSKQLQVTFIVLTIFIVFVLEVVGDRDSDSQFGCEERLNMTTESIFIGETYFRALN
ncbi:unnamed protein product [Brassica oleracea]